MSIRPGDPVTFKVREIDETIKRINHALAER